MLVPLEEVKAYIGISDTSFDTFLLNEEEVISQSAEGYCGRKFLTARYVQTFYASDYGEAVKQLPLFHYPVTKLESVLEGAVDITAKIRIHKDTGTISYDPTAPLQDIFLQGFFEYGFYNTNPSVSVTYVAGYEVLPAPVKSVILSLIEERYNRKKSGASLNFGSDVQSVSIPGTISIAFDYSLQSNERKTAYGTLLGNYINVLDIYRSERRIVGSGTLAYLG